MRSNTCITLLAYANNSHTTLPLLFLSFLICSTVLLGNHQHCKCIHSSIYIAAYVCASPPLSPPSVDSRPEATLRLTDGKLESQLKIECHDDDDNRYRTPLFLFSNLSINITEANVHVTLQDLHSCFFNLHLSPTRSLAHPLKGIECSRSSTVDS